MILTELKIHGLRSFSEEQTLRVESDVTVLTGANDVGKTAVLQLIRKLYRLEQCNEDDANFDRLRDLPGSLKGNTAFGLEATFKITEWNEYIDNLPNLDDLEVDVRYHPYQPGIGIHSVTNKERDVIRSSPESLPPKIIEMPKSIDLNEGPPIRSQVSQSDLNPSEDHLFTMAFGPNYLQKLMEYSDDVFQSQKRSGVATLNRKLERNLPKTLPLTFAIEVDRQESLSFVVGIQDSVSGDTPVRLRGAGAQKLLRLMVDLLSVDLDSEQVIILLDEPENSLHADAQHALRRVLETLAIEPHVQVIYATHSPSMINSCRPRSLRLLSRELSKDGDPTTRINNKPYEGGSYQLIRTSLGMNPADSLLYSAITVIVEGETEVLGLNKYFERLLPLLPDPYLEVVMGQVQIFGAGGFNNVHKWVKLAFSQRSMPVVFVDGHDTDTLKTRLDKLALNGYEVPLIHFDEGKEFEDIVPRSIYFQALAEIMQTEDEVSEEAFDRWYDEWRNSPDSHDIAMFSNKVSKWTRQEFDWQLDKPRVMERALEIPPIAQVEFEPIATLVRTIRALASTL